MQIPQDFNVVQIYLKSLNTRYFQHTENEVSVHTFNSHN